jgi:ATP phosphoribosyltransferase regulatory subunit
MQYFHGLLEALNLDPTAQARLQQAIDRNSEAELAAFLRDTRLPEPHQRTLRELPQLSGRNLEKILGQAEGLSLNATMRAAVENLRHILRALQPYAVLNHLSLDLTEIHDLGYYTGITFELLAPGLGFRVASGGRYDDLVGTFGAPLPAVGVAFGIERLLLARSEERPSSRPVRPLAPHLLVTTGYDPQFIAALEQARRQGLRIAVDLEQRRGDELWRAALGMAAPCAAAWCDGQAHWASLDGAEPAIETLNLDELNARLTTLAAWTRSNPEIPGHSASSRNDQDA